MTDHPLTETAAAEMWDGHVPPQLNFQGWTWDDRRSILDALRAAFDAGREHERANPDDRPWGPLKKGDPLHVGDEVRQEWYGVTRTGVVGRVDGNGDPWTAEGGYIGPIQGGTWYVRRTAQELPTGLGAVIVAKEEGGSIEATVLGVVWRAREAVFGAGGRWHGVWRSTSGAISYAEPDQITPGTWKVEGE